MAPPSPKSKNNLGGILFMILFTRVSMILIALISTMTIAYVWFVSRSRAENYENTPGVIYASSTLPPKNVRPRVIK